MFFRFSSRPFVVTPFLCLLLFLSVGCRHADREARALKNMRENTTPMRLRDKVTLEPSSGTIRLERTGATVTVSPAVRAEDLGVALYPGAKSTGKQYALRDDAKSGTTASYFIVLETRDSLDTVVEFYRKQLGPRATVRDLRPQNRPLVALAIEAPGSTLSVTAESDGGATRITILAFSGAQTKH